MPEEEILSLPQGSAKNLIKKGEMTILAPPKEQQPQVAGTERAKELFGDDVLGAEAILTMEQKLQQAGVNVKFEIPQIGFKYMEPDLQRAKEDATRGRERFVTLRPSWMSVDGQRKPITLVSLRDLFRQEQQVKEGRKTVTVVTYDKNPFGDGAVFYNQDWYDNEDFANKQMIEAYAMPTNETLADSLNISWNDQVNLIEQGEVRRDAVETAWDTILYYAKTGRRLLKTKYDWGHDQSSYGRRVYVGYFGANGLIVYDWHPDDSSPDFGVCPSR